MIKSFQVVCGNAENAVRIMREVAQWCIDSGIQGWNPENLTVDKLIPGLTEDNFCIGQVDGRDACCMILQWDDRLFWPEATENEAGYIHKLCTRREFAGLRLSEKMVEYAAAECRKKGLRFLRLDTGWHKEKLCSIYESLGFVKVGKRTIGVKEYALYEKKID